MEILNVSVSELGLCLIFIFPEAVEGLIRNEQSLFVLREQKRKRIPIVFYRNVEDFMLRKTV